MQPTGLSFFCLQLPWGWEAEAEHKRQRPGRKMIFSAAVRAGLVFSHNLVEHVCAAHKLKKKEMGGTRSMCVSSGKHAK